MTPDSVDSPQPSDLSNMDSQPLKKRHLEASNGIEEPAIKRMNMGVIRQAGHVKDNPVNAFIC
jgi:hypothetical protein